MKICTLLGMWHLGRVKTCRRQRPWWLVVFLSMPFLDALARMQGLSNSVSVQRANVPEQVQDTLKTKFNITLPDIETPDFLQVGFSAP